MEGIKSLPIPVLLLAILVSCDRQDQPTAETPTESMPAIGPVGKSGLQGHIKSIELAPPNHSDGPMFVALSPDQTGVHFISVLKKNNDVAFLNTGAGLAVGDYDGDGRPDLYLVSTDSPNRLYRQIAPFQFEDVSDEAGVNGGQAWSRSATFVDINDDGNLDLYVCNTEAPNLLYVNQGDGTFREMARAYGLDHVANSISATFADYDRDGDLDMYLVTNRLFRSKHPRMLINRVEPPADTVKTIQELMPKWPSEIRVMDNLDGTIAVIPEHREHAFFYREVNGKAQVAQAGPLDALYRNNGDGTFTDITRQAGLIDYGCGLSANWLDFDGDDWLDLYVTNDLLTKDRLYLNQRNGTFIESLASMMPHTSWFSMGADSGDVNNDGLMDFFVADMAGTNHYRSKMLMGDMSEFRWFMTNEWPRQLMRNNLYLNTGTSRYMEIAQQAGVAASDWTWSIRFGDLDNDGYLDLFASNGHSRDGMNQDLTVIQFNKVLQEQGRNAANKFLGQLPPRHEENLAYRNTGQLRFEDVSASWGLNHNGVSFGAVYADFDRDGDLDLVVNNLNELASIYRNNSTHGHRVLFQCRGTVSNHYGIGAKLTIQTDLGTQVRLLIPSRGFMSSDEPAVHFGLGEDQIIRTVTVNWPSGHHQTFKNLPGDHLYVITEPHVPASPTLPPRPPPTQFELVATSCGLDIVHRESDFDDYKDQPLLPGKLSQLGPGLAWDDVDGDGDDDLFIAGAAGDAGSLLINLGDGQFENSTGQPWEDHTGCEDMGALFFDADSDGDVDLYVTSGSVEHPSGHKLLKDRLYLNDGSGQFTTADGGILPDLAESSGAVVAADYDNDGDLDLFVGGRVIPGKYPLAPKSVLLRNDGGRFVDVTDQLAPGLSDAGLVTAALWSDVDSDSQIDLLIALEWGPVKFFHNDGGSFVDETESANLARYTGWWNGITGADLDGDMDIDYVVTNTGLNTKYGTPTDKKPAMLYYGDMDNSGIMRLIEAKQIGADQLPIRGRSCSSNAIPSVGKKFTTFHDFASTDLFHIYTPQCLAEAKHFKANTLASGVLINDGAGRFTFRPLPWLAQASPGFGVIAADLDADADTDIYFVQNLFSREPETGLWDGGLSALLHNDGHSGLTMASPVETGLLVSGDAKGLVVGDLDQDAWPDLILTQNNHRLLAFRNRGIDGRRCLAIRLRGRRGNPSAIGARVTVIHTDQKKHTAEVYAGSGYLSQSPPWLFFGIREEQWPQAINVRWPDGSQSTHHPARIEGAARIIINQPSDQTSKTQ